MGCGCESAALGFLNGILSRVKPYGRALFLSIMQRETCVFYASWFEAIETLPKAIQSEAYRAIMMYALRGVEVEEQGQMTKLIMAMVKPVIDTNNKRYENGCKGGRPKAEKPKRNQTITKTKPHRKFG